MRSNTIWFHPQMRISKNIKYNTILNYFMTKKTFFVLLTCIMFVFALSATAGPKKKVHTIGDSTMANYADNSTDRRGWAQMLQQFFNPANITIDNRAKSGASSKSFYKESPFWPTLIKGGNDEMQSGDFLIIQFAHNDEKTNGADGDEVRSYYRNKGAVQRLSDIDYRGTTPFDTYKTYIKNFITEAKAMGVKPIVVAPVCRKNFSANGKEITRLGRHDLGDKFSSIKNKLLIENQKVSTTDHTYDYVAAAKAVTEQFDDVPFIDLTDITAKMFTKYGEPYCSSHIFVTGDKSHLTAMGATLVSRAFAQAIVNQAASEGFGKRKDVLTELAKEITITTGISFNPASGNMGEIYVGNETSKSFSLSAFDLASQTGKMSVSASNGFEVSRDGSNWYTHIDYDYEGATIMSTVYVRIKPSVAGVITGKLTATDGTASKSIDLKVNSLNKAIGDEASSIWGLHSGSLSATSSIIMGADVTMSGMMFTQNAAIPMTPTGHDKMMLFSIQGGTWPGGEIDEVSTRYIQFAVRNPTDKQFNLEEISLDLCGWGGSSMCYHVYYATKDDFSDEILIGEGSSLAAKKTESVYKSLVSRIVPNGSLYIRVYPWLNVSASTKGKSIGISDVRVKGVMTTPPPAPKAVKKTTVAVKKKTKARK